jgi:hypothetical protein
VLSRLGSPGFWWTKAVVVQPLMRFECRFVPFCQGCRQCCHLIWVQVRMHIMSQSAVGASCVEDSLGLLVSSVGRYVYLRYEDMVTVHYASLSYPCACALAPTIGFWTQCVEDLVGLLVSCGAAVWEVLCVPSSSRCS